MSRAVAIVNNPVLLEPQSHRVIPYLALQIPILIVVALLLAGTLVTYIIWHLPWLKKPLRARIAVLVAALILLSLIGTFVRPKALKIVPREDPFANKQPVSTQPEQNSPTSTESSEGIQTPNELSKPEVTPNVQPRTETVRRTVKELPDIAARVVRPKGFGIVFQNVSQFAGTVVRDPQFSLFIWDLDVDGSDPILKLTKTFTGDLVRKDELFFAADFAQLPQPARPGDRLIGGLIVGCFECVRSRGYEINMVYGQGGTFIEYPEFAYPNLDRMRASLSAIRKRPENFFITDFPESSVQVITDP